MFVNLAGDVTINKLELVALFAQLLFLVLWMAPLTHICTYMYNTVDQGWDNCVRFRSSSAVGPIIQDLAMVARRYHLHYSHIHITSEDKKMADAASILTHLSMRLFLHHFRTHLLQQNHW